MEDLKMLKNFSMLIPSENFKSWKGYLLLRMHNIYIEITCPNFPQLENLKVIIPELDVIGFHQFNLSKAVEMIKMKTHSLAEFLEDLVTALDNIWKQDFHSNLQHLNDLWTNDNFYNIIQEVNLCGQYVHQMDENLKHVTFNVLDLCKRNHFIKVHIPDDYPTVKSMLLFETMLPSVTTNSLLKKKTIFKLFKKFKSIIDEINSFCDVHEEIVNTCNVIGSYTFKDLHYRIPIDNNVCVEVEVDPFNPNSCPKFYLHGQLGFTEKFQLRLNDIDPIIIWNSEKSFKDNILDVFKIDSLQSQYELNEHDHNVKPTNNENYCLICYDQLDSVTKKQTKTCVIEKCNAIYHMACICEWFLNSGSTPKFDHLQGKCPQCEEDMIVALESFDLIKT